MLKAEDILSISRQIKNGSQYENPRYELKREFWKVIDENGKKNNEAQEEFVKDMAAMANTQGNDAYIIIGIDGDSGELHNTSMPIDQSRLVDILYSKLQEPFDAEFYEIEVGSCLIVVIHIPQSFNKPHILKLYKNKQNYIPVRKGTRTDSATRYDLDLMYNDRNKVITPPYKLELFCGFDYEILTSYCRISLDVLNSGSNINVLKNVMMEISNYDQTEIGYIRPQSYSVYDYNTHIRPQDIDYYSDTLIKIKSNDITQVRFLINFDNDSALTELLRNSEHGRRFLGSISGQDIRGTSCSTNLFWLEMNRKRS